MTGAAKPLRAPGSGRYEGVGLGDDRGLQVEALVLVVDATVVDLDGDRTDPARGLVGEPQHLGRLARGRLVRQRTARHPGHTCGLVGDQLTLRPLLDVDALVVVLLEQLAAAVVVPGAVVPVTAVRRLELDGGQG